MIRIAKGPPTEAGAYFWRVCNHPDFPWNPVRVVSAIRPTLGRLHFYSQDSFAYIPVDSCGGQWSTRIPDPEETDGE